MIDTESLAYKRQTARQYIELPYAIKVDLARDRICEWQAVCNEHGKNMHVSVGGLDSITLLYLIRDTLPYADIPAISISSLEDKSIQEIHKQIGVIAIKPYKSKVQVLNELGFPVISKEKASKISNLQKPNNPKQTFIHAIMTGDMGAQGKFQHSKKIKLPDKWIRLFGGLYQDHRPDLPSKVAPFPVSAECCYWMKERPAEDWAKAHNSWPFLGLMQSEGGQRELGLVRNGCNYVGKSTARSCPFNYFTRQDLLHSRTSPTDLRYD